MTREEAAKMVEAVVTQTFGELSHNDNHDSYHEAFLLAIATLRSGWVKTSERLPAEADAGYNEEVVALYRDGDTETVGCDYWKYVAKHPEYFPYWMPLPKLPEVEG